MTETTHENHSNEETVTDQGGRQRPSYDDVNMPVVIMVGIISMVLTFVTIWFVEGVYYQWSNNLITERQYKANSIQTQTINDQKQALMEGDESKGIVGFDSVKGDVIARYQNNQPATADDSEGSNEQEN